MPVPIPFRSVQRVYFDDLDALNILHNVRFLLFMERARGEFFNALGFRWEDEIAKNPDKSHVVAEHAIKYLHPVLGEGELEITLVPTHLGRSSFIIAAKVLSVDGKRTYAEGSTRLVRLEPVPLVGATAGVKPRPCPWSDRFRSQIEPLVLRG